VTWGGRLRVAGTQLGLLVLLVALWWWLTHTGGVSPLILPKPELVLGRLVAMIGTATVLDSLRITLTEVAGAFALSLVAGVGLGFLAGRTPYGAQLTGPVVAWFQTVPIILLYPICILLFGIGIWSKIVFAGLYGLFPMAYNTITGLRGVDERHLLAARSLGASPRQMLWQVQVPAALPVIVAGIRLGAALNLIGVLAGEILASQAGLGYQIAAAAGTFQTPDLYAYIIMALVLVTVFNAVVTRTREQGMMA
jgi:ABC-type nitrate/sulfonate/bicarbonate transport system permease component